MARAAFVVAALLVSGCELGITSRVGGHREVAGVVLVREEGAELAPVAALPAGGPSAVTARFVDSDGRAIDLREPDHHVSFRWEPAGSATSAPVPGERFTHDVTVQRPCAPPQRVFVGYGHDVRADELIFGPIPVEVNGPVGSARAFALDSTELAPEVRFVSQTPTTIEVRYYDCAGQLLEGLEEEHEGLLFFSRPDLVEWERVPGDGFHFEVTMTAEPGTEGQMSFGIRRLGERAYQSFGPLPLFVD